MYQVKAESVSENEEPVVFQRLRAGAKEAGWDAVVALSQDNVTYTAGFLVPSHATNRFRRTMTVLAGETFATQIVVSVEHAQALARSRFKDVRAYDQFDENPADVLASVLEEAGVSRGIIGIELGFIPTADYLQLRKRLPNATFVECGDLYFKCRMEKTEDEISILQKVGELTETVIHDTVKEIRVGMTELEIASRLMGRMIEGGSTNVKYRVGSGINGSITNCGTTSKRIERGEIIRIEVLGDLDNYRSNVTRTLVVGPPSVRQAEIYGRLIEARDACRELLRPGLSVPVLYQTYVKRCLENGITPTLRFLGHGIGQTIHEEPYITETRQVVFKSNFAFTMEPLYMIPGEMGFHTEDMYLITATGYEMITGKILPNDELIEVG